jgi:hypothetical protein
MDYSIGGTPGAPMEWRRAVLDLDFYTQILNGEPLPNDDLDIQLLWLVALEEKSIDLIAHTLNSGRSSHAASERIGKAVSDVAGAAWRAIASCDGGQSW